MMLHRLVWVYTCQNATLLEITCHGSFLFLRYVSAPCTGQMQTVQCYSGLDAYDTTHCELGVNGSSVISLRVVRVQWDPPCNFKTDINYTRVMVEDGGYGFDDNIMWSADGCTGIFEYCLECKCNAKNIIEP